jgi:hypothetical protein
MAAFRAPLKAAALLLALTALLSAPRAAAQEVSFKLSPPAHKPRLAEPFTLRLEITRPASYAVTPDTASFPSDTFELTGIRELSSKTEGGRATGTYEIRAAAFGIGVSTFPAIVWRLAAGPEVKEALSPEAPLDIKPVFDPAKEPEGIRDIRPPFRFIPWPWLIAALLAAGAGAWYLYRRRAASAAAAAAAPPDLRTPYQKASEALAELSASALWREGRIKEFYSRLADIFRGYLDARLGIRAGLRTTGDIARDLRKGGADIAMVVSTRALLEKADLVKFARLKPAENERDTDLSAAKDLLLAFDRREEERLAAEAAKAAAQTAARNGVTK